MGSEFALPFFCISSFNYLSGDIACSMRGGKMNYCGSYRKLLGNAKAAIFAAIEIYNKPIFEYRDGCFVILLLNAWELMLKAILSKNRKSIFYKKKRKMPYRTLSWRDAIVKAERYFPKGVSARAIRENIQMIGLYRDNSVHFYNEPDFGVIIYALAQTSVKNFRDILYEIFKYELESEINWQLMPLGIRPPIDPITYMSKSLTAKKKTSDAVRQYIAELYKAVNEIEQENGDAGRLLTIFTVNFQSVKKIEKSDIVVGIEKGAKIEGPLVVTKTKDPNVTHPMRTKDVIESIDDIHGIKFTSCVFYAIVYQYEIKNNENLC